MTRNDEGIGFLLQYENVAWYEDGAVRILDRRIFPIRTEYVTCHSHKEVAQAIADMVTQSGGPYLAAAMGMALAAWEAKSLTGEDALAFLKDAAYTLSHARPTTMNKMIHVTERALAVAEEAVRSGKTGQSLVDALQENAINQVNENYHRYDMVAEYLADLIPQNGTIMTQCFAETIIGTLLRECRKRGNEIHMICPETRPYFQGARLTASVAASMGFDVTVITDNMPGCCMSQKKIDLFTSAADVITMDGHVINKVGTFQIATMANYFGVPYYVTGSPEQEHPDAVSVKIEQRNPDLVMDALGVRTTMPQVKGWYPAFDITPPELVAGVVTEKGIYRPGELNRYFEGTVYAGGFV